MPGKLKSILVWGLRWLGLVALICLAGGFLGAVLFPIAGHLLGMDLATRDMVRNGVFDGGFFALIWAPGLSLVICIMWAHAQLSRKRD
ncbi:MAG: hypothetical protein AB3N33_02140 [Puniceicoccaceae bacterium]